MTCYGNVYFKDNRCILQTIFYYNYKLIMYIHIVQIIDYKFQHKTTFKHVDVKTQKTCGSLNRSSISSFKISKLRRHSKNAILDHNIKHHIFHVQQYRTNQAKRQ